MVLRITFEELHRHFDHYLERASHGECFVITANGADCARLIPWLPDRLPAEQGQDDTPNAPDP